MTGPVADIRPVHDVIAIDGEGITIGKQHLYTLLLAYDSKYQKSRYIENWQQGLSTDRILSFLLHLRRGRGALCCAYYFNYDVTLWLKDLSDDERTALWRSGWLVWRGPDSRTLYYLRYIPSKIFFVAEYNTTMGPRPSMFDWRKSALPSTTIYDTSGFAQRAFVRALEEWGIDSGNIGEMKNERATFSRQDHSRILDYCEDECVALSEWIQKQDRTFLEEGINLHSWHGAGAIADQFLRANHVADYIRDPVEMPPLMDAITCAYFGGRSEVFQMGEIPGPIYDYDINSAYPAMARLLPDLAHGRWRYTHVYEPQQRYALWRVRWNVGNTCRLCPLPFRYRHGVYYPSAGDGWYHACEVEATLRYFPGIRQDTGVLEGWVYEPESEYRPLAFIEEYATRRVQYKESGDPRAIPYKYGLNAIYGKLAQHARDEISTPKYQSYYAAGFITAATRAMLLHFIHWGGMGTQDVYMVATDGIFCGKPRTAFSGNGLGRFQLAGTLDTMILIQPGCWYAPTDSRTRGFHKDSLTYERAQHVWRNEGIHGILPYAETRFVGLGTCAGTGDYSDYACWVRYADEVGADKPARTLTFMPDHKYPSADLLKGAPHGRLIPMDMSTCGLSEPYQPPRMADETYAVESLEYLLSQWSSLDQPDIDE